MVRYSQGTDEHFFLKVLKYRLDYSFQVEKLNNSFKNTILYCGHTYQIFPSLFLVILLSRDV